MLADALSGRDRPATRTGEWLAPRPGRMDNPAGHGLAEKSAHRQFAEVFLPHLVDAYRLARWLAGSRSDADDIVQEASLRAFRGIDGFSGANPRGWVLSIVRNAAYSWMT